eukprot:scaffold4617_cov165-Skeletonema_marinoi.AAC.2
MKWRASPPPNRTFRAIDFSVHITKDTPAATYRSLLSFTKLGTMADEDNSTPAAPPADTAEAEASSAGADAAVNDATAAISSIAVEDASDDEANEAVPAPPPQEEEEDEVVPPPPAAAAYQFNFNPPPPQPHLAAADPNNMDFANLNPSEINAQFLSLLPPCIHPRLDKLKSLSEDRASNGQEVKGIPQFWACAMGHIDLLAELITEEDVDCMEHLVDVTCDDFADGSGFELHFHFSPNDFFTNSVLTKRYEVPNLLTEDEPMLQSVTGTDIHWKPNKSLTHKTITKKQRKKGGPNAGQVRTIQKTERAESFFHFFTPPKMPELGDVVDEEEAEAMEEHFDHDYEMACAIRGSLIPNAVHWFTGEAMEEAMYGDEGMDMMFDEEDEEDDGEGGLNPFPPWSKVL